MNQLTLTQVFLNGSLEYQFIPKNVCCKIINITVDVDLNVLQVEIVGGCPGNGLGVSKLCIGKSLDEVIDTLSGIDCRGRGTSCPDQLARACMELKNKILKTC